MRSPTALVLVVDKNKFRPIKDCSVCSFITGLFPDYSVCYVANLLSPCCHCRFITPSVSEPCLIHPLYTTD